MPKKYRFSPRKSLNKQQQQQIQDWGREKGRGDLIPTVAKLHYLKYSVSTKNCTACKKEGKYGPYTGGKNQ